MSNANAHRNQIALQNTRLNSYSRYVSPNVGSGNSHTFAGVIPKVFTQPVTYQNHLNGYLNPPNSVQTSPTNYPRPIVVGPIVKGRPVQKVTPVAGRLYPL